MAVALLSSLVGASFLNVLFKNLFQRPRPVGLNLVAETGFSFPSGHAMLSMAVLGMLVVIAHDRMRPGRRRLLVIAGLSALILLVGLSRLYLGVHYPSDVLAGYLASLCWVALVHWALRVRPLTSGVAGMAAIQTRRPGRA